MQRKSIVFFIVVTIILIVGMWALTPLATSVFADTPEQKGQFGDLFGSINALFSGLAFAGMIVTLWFQREELHLQREEIAQTREELRAQREEFEEQNKTLHRQRFESIFFNMLSLHEQIAENVEAGICDDKGVRLIGRPVFKKIVNTIKTDYAVSSVIHGGKTNFKDFLQTKHDYKFFNQYLRHAYEILKLIDSSDLITDTERISYVDIMRSQLADSELALLVIYAFSDKGENFLCLAKRYSFFDDFPKGILPEDILNQVI